MEKQTTPKYPLRTKNGYGGLNFPPKTQRKPVTPEMLARGRNVQLMIAGVVLLAFPTYELYRRLYLGTERKIQTGEILPDNSIRTFDEDEKIYRDKNSFFVKIFGEK